MKRNVRITIFGGKNVGKTSFLYGMYGVMSKGVNNFHLLASDWDTDNRLRRGWSALLKQGQERQWPLPTSASINKYSFSFKTGDRNLLDVEWIDYRGGALKEDRTRATELIEHLNKSDCLFLCLDGADLQTPIGQRLASVGQSMNLDKAKLIVEQMQRRVPIAALITKHDLCRHRPKDELMGDISLLLESWMQPGGGWDLLVCPVTLGAELAEDPENGALNPKNLHVPLIYATMAILIDELVTQERKVSDAAAAHKQAVKRVRELDKGLKIFRNKGEFKRANTEAERLKKRQIAEQDVATLLRDDVTSLGKQLVNAVMFCDGQRVLV